MKKRYLVALVAVAIGSLAYHKVSVAHGCSGPGSCTQETTNNHNNPYQRQGQDQQQRTMQDQYSTAGSNATTNNNSRYLSVRPVHVDQPHIVVPSAAVNRSVSGQCGPRMKIVHRTIKGLNNRPLTVAEFDAGTEQYTIPDEVPYRRIELTPSLYQLIGHRVNTTTAVVTVSTGGGLGFGFNTNAGGGGSAGVTAGSGIQRLVTTINLEECLAYEIDNRPISKAPPPAPVAKPKPRPKRKPVVKPKEVCVPCTNPPKK